MGSAAGPAHLRMRAGTTTSFSNMTPRSTRLSWMSPPGIFSTLAYFLWRHDIKREKQVWTC